MFNRGPIASLALAAAASLGVASMAEAPRARRPQPRPAKGSSLFRRAATFFKPYDVNINRHTGKPHEHKREIARRSRQAAARG